MKEIEVKVSPHTYSCNYYVIEYREEEIQFV